MRRKSLIELIRGSTGCIGVRPGIVAWVWTLWLWVGVIPVQAQLSRAVPEKLLEVGIDDKSGKVLPLDLTYVDTSGKRIKLGDRFSSGRPVILSLTYSDCPMLCHLQLDGLVQSLRDMDWSPGEEFDVVNVSIDPQETWQRARKMRKKHVDAYGRRETIGGWHFLTGTEKSIRTLADAVGFRYRYVPETKEYAHAACVIICAPDGTVSRYLYGVSYPPRTVRLSLVEAGEGKIGSALDQVILFCFHYDAATGRYAPVAMRLMQIGGTLTLGTLLVGLIPYWLRKKKNSSSELRLEEVEEGTDQKLDQVTQAETI